MGFFLSLVPNLMKDILWAIPLNPRPIEYSTQEQELWKNQPMWNAENTLSVKQGKGPNWLFDIDSFTQIFEPLIFSNMESSSSQAPPSTFSSDYRLYFSKSSISLRRPSIDPPSVMEAFEASAARTTLSNVTSSSLSENENLNEDSLVNAVDAANTIADNTDVVVDIEDSSTMN
ncbi:hypothetical protein L1987_15240 [Smallanthus sonchifolius]|uniref:Uncharacterized protein n=1 Tax=Smallanthus sonchifolius TaxID=185202 RepID=A0ACB9J7B9_9ASTR|nr:hypothetical protein L1987_15240 [Smallanthus sonchifolius]